MNARHRALVALAAWTLTLTLTLAGCGDDHDDEPDPAMLACDELGESPREVTAADAREATAPQIAFDGEPVRVSLPAGAAGYVRVVTDEPEELGILLFDQTDALAAIWFEDTSMAPISAGENPFCPDEIREHFDVDFEEQGTYYLELGPTASDSVWMILSGAEGHGH